MSAIAYIRQRYGVPAYIGRRVAIKMARLTGPDVPGTIAGADTYLIVRPDPGQGYSKSYRCRCHPQEVRYLTAQNTERFP